MAVLLVRHARAGSRRKWDKPDRLRPLTARGRSEAQGLVATLSGFGVERVLSSPYLRCTETVGPLAADCGLAVETSASLAEGGGDKAVDLSHELLRSPGDTVLCTHGDVVEDVLDALGESAGSGPFRPRRPLVGAAGDPG